MALLSNKMALPLVRKIARTMKRRFGDEAAIVVMLDPEWDAHAVKKKEHPIDTLVARLRDAAVEVGNRLRGAEVCRGGDGHHGGIVEGRGGWIIAEDGWRDLGRSGAGLR